jgi:hypothetical protein
VSRHPLQFGVALCGLLLSLEGTTTVLAEVSPAKLALACSANDRPAITEEDKVIYDEYRLQLDQVKRFVPLPQHPKIYIDYPRKTPTGGVAKLLGRRDEAEAAACPDGTPIALINNAFLTSIGREEDDLSSSWSMLFVIYHELGHALYHHDDVKVRNCKIQKPLEDQADYFSGYVLANLGATQLEAVEGLSLLYKSGRHYSECYSNVDKRKENVRRGWAQHISGSPAAIESFKIYPQTDLAGHDLRHFFSASADDCAARCVAHKINSKRDCAAFSFDRRSQVCYLKSKQPGSPFTDADEVLVYEPFSLTGIPVNVPDPGYEFNSSLTSLPRQIYSKLDQRTCHLFNIEAQGKEFLTAPYQSKAFDPRKESERGAICREVCRTDARCQAAYAGIVRQTGVGICKLYEEVGATHPSLDRSSVIHVRQFRFDPQCDYRNAKSP